ncbi:MAG TPA: type II toxin-antitoxin system PemK/MazF family toxin [Allosphingosinicella sp.]|jgi:mRNA interferase MazF|nr:type II toxin-antitoxin system PemK/MazF family toxin [Allosphingosinicella sp.]
MVIAQGEIRLADLADPIGSSAGYRRPILVAQGDALNASRIATVLCVPLASNPKWADAPGNVLPERETGLDRDSVANVSLLVAVDKEQLDERVGQVPRRTLERVLAGIDVVLGR